MSEEVSSQSLRDEHKEIRPRYEALCRRIDTLTTDEFNELNVLATRLDEIIHELKERRTGGEFAGLAANALALLIDETQKAQALGNTSLAQQKALAATRILESLKPSFDDLRDEFHPTIDCFSG